MNSILICRFSIVWDLGLSLWAECEACRHRCGVVGCLVVIPSRIGLNDQIRCQGLKQDHCPVICYWVNVHVSLFLERALQLYYLMYLYALYCTHSRGNNKLCTALCTRTISRPVKCMEGWKRIWQRTTAWTPTTRNTHRLHLFILPPIPLQSSYTLLQEDSDTDRKPPQQSHN